MYPQVQKYNPLLSPGKCPVALEAQIALLTTQCFFVVQLQVRAPSSGVCWFVPFSWLSWLLSIQAWSHSLIALCTPASWRFSPNHLSYSLGSCINSPTLGWRLLVGILLQVLELIMGSKTWVEKVPIGTILRSGFYFFQNNYSSQAFLLLLYF